MSDTGASEQTGSGLTRVLREQGRKLAEGEAGYLLVLLMVAAIWTFFQLQNDRFLSPGNLTNLMLQQAAVATISIGVVLILLLGEIDLSVGAVSGFCASVMAVLVVQKGVAPWLAILAALGLGAAVGLFNGFMITRFQIPSFVVTLAGSLALVGLQLYVLGETGTVNLGDNLITRLTSTFFPPLVGWAVALLAIAATFAVALVGRTRRRAAGPACDTSAQRHCANVRSWGRSGGGGRGVEHGPRTAAGHRDPVRNRTSVLLHHRVRAFWASHVCGWRQCRSCAQGRRSDQQRASAGVHPRLDTRGGRWRTRRFATHGGEPVIRRKRPAADGYRRTGHRRYEPLWRTRLCVVGNTRSRGHRLDCQRDEPAGVRLVSEVHRHGYCADRRGHDRVDHPHATQSLLTLSYLSSTGSAVSWMLVPTLTGPHEKLPSSFGTTEVISRVPPGI